MCLTHIVKLDEPSFLIETHSRPGYSGSPVYGYISPEQPRLGVHRELTQRTFYWVLPGGIYQSRNAFELKKGKNSAPS